MTKEKKYLIVGSGLAGISVAYHLIEKGFNVTMINNQENHSSLVAAGQINPLVFRRMTKSWRVDEFLPYAKTFYKDLEQKTSEEFYIPKTIRRLFSSAHEKELWLKKEDRIDFEPYMTKINSEDESYNLVKNEFGSGRIKQSSYVVAQKFLAGSLLWISKFGKISNETFDYDELNPSTGVYRGEEYDKIIFCEGYLNKNNPWFKHLPVETTKGEVLSFKSNHLPEEESLNRKCFILPIGKDVYRLGATYVWETENLEKTEKGKEELLAKYAMLSNDPIEILSHQVGIRPTSPDRRPIVGIHSEYEKLAIYNGLGTKGYMISPLLSREFIAFLIDGKELDKEIRLERFQK